MGADAGWNELVALDPHHCLQDRLVQARRVVHAGVGPDLVDQGGSQGQVVSTPGMGRQERDKQAQGAGFQAASWHDSLSRNIHEP